MKKYLTIGVFAILALASCTEKPVEETEDISGPGSLRVAVFDTKYYARGEALVSGTLTASGEQLFSWDYASTDVVARDSVSNYFDINGGVLKDVVATITTARHEYEFRYETLTLRGGQENLLALNMSAPAEQPKRRVAILGDSISTYEGWLVSPECRIYYPTTWNEELYNQEEAVNDVSLTWWHRLIYSKMVNAELDVNNSWSGSRVSYHTTAGSATGTMMECGYVSRLEWFDDPDIIIIHGGTNDRSASIQQGSYHYDLELSKLDLYSFRESYIYMIRRLQELYPWVKIITIIGDTLTTSFAESILTISAHYGLPCVDFTYESDNIPKMQTSHPNITGMRFMANEIYAQCRNYLP